ncbi:hypothetical protein [Pseudoduganella umbonata]|uniref:Uncharacterized protein n=1 Tax=Pseudoduganella umbonata TaxID=864828 RepID=A0A4P8HNQ7_9BURK|nr:hypothetical protein [Pseudoduganella umbonata]MBB3220044.1 hypothetical protein [Pseudoduganella umbonata]QCP10050.1 hypothetical protein FCL38_06135 [Pseudoduganella umbonata]
MDRQRADRRLLDYKPELELPPVDEVAAPSDGGSRGDYGELDFAVRLLEARSAAELAPVLADLVGPAANARQAAAREPVLRVLQRAARMIFPLDATGAPADLKRKASAVFGLELEGLSPEDKEFEVARHFVRLASDAARQALARAAQPPGQAAQQALMQAARRNAPGLLRQRSRPAEPAGPQGGNWRRRGQRIQIIDL